MDQSRLEELEQQYRELYGGNAPEIIVRAPGRVNLIGEHTDYNDGFVFPCAIERDILIAAGKRRDRQIRAYALNFHQPTTFPLHNPPHIPQGRERWSNYLRAMATIFDAEGLPLVGVNCVMLGNVPVGSGLSSSAAILVAAGWMLATAAEITVEPVKMALMAQRAEREFVGVNVGIMDQYISALGKRDHALLIDTRSLDYEAVPLPQSGVSVVIADTNKKRGLVDSEYNTRRSECEQAVELLKTHLPEIIALRDVSSEQFERYADELPETVRKRARHVITENERVLLSVEALKAGRIDAFGELMNASHESLRLDYEVSCAELDALVEAARSVDGVYGARMTGAGFGGCTVSMVADDALEAFQREVPAKYKNATGLETTIYVTTAAQGAERLK
jgi:galactokinase